jgi:hypothetical protein
MTNIDFDDEFYSNVDEFIRLANKLAKHIDDEKLAATLNLAASRYSAYNVASSSQNLNELKALRKEALEYFLPVFQSNLVRNLDHFESNYDDFVEKHRNT